MAAGQGRSQRSALFHERDHRASAGFAGEEPASRQNPREFVPHSP